MGQWWSRARGPPQLCITHCPCCAALGAVQGMGPVVLVVGRWEGVVAVDSPVYVTFAVEESSFSRAGEWYHQPGHSTGTGNQDWEPVP